ncbi:MIP family Ig-specific serine endopeptidase [Mycoplasmopsis pullorum]|uniref:DUF31 domain-containing protein n=1 Tax=Mycoplasmopsis pullorum TaxID=48003 RepID=A0A1L4FS07_9BACT|nr:hypothetical protein [Mycoplasmopsis pullorum]APJ38374.1 hypothetical protein BLA55_01650 [Mycoplasmopsis pullorum]
MNKNKLKKILLATTLIGTYSPLLVACQIKTIEPKKEINDRNPEPEVKQGSAKIIDEYKEDILNARYLIEQKYSLYNETIERQKAFLSAANSLKEAYEAEHQKFEKLQEQINEIKIKRESELEKLSKFNFFESEDGIQISGKLAIGLNVNINEYPKITDIELKNLIVKINQINSEYNKLKLDKVTTYSNYLNSKRDYENNQTQISQSENLLKQTNIEIGELEKSIVEKNRWIQKYSKEHKLSFKAIEIKLKKIKEIIDENGVKKAIYEQPEDKVEEDLKFDDNVVPSFPTGPIQIPKFDENAHKYPDFASEFTKMSPVDIYKEIYDRTFSIKYAFKETPNGGVIRDIYQGTAWILDYHKYQNSNKYKIFMASNMHVLGQMSNTLGTTLDKKLGYFDPTGSTVVDFDLGKTEQTPTNFGSIPNESYSKYINSRGGNTIYYNSKTLGLENPKMVFGAVDYIRDSTLYSPVKTREYKNQIIIGDQLEAPTYDRVEKEKKTKILENMSRMRYIPYFSDFGVFEFDVDLDSPRLNSKFKGWINKAIKALDNYINRNKNPNNKTPNRFVDDLPFLSADYLSAGKMRLKGKHLDYEAISLANAKDVYIGGYPKNSATRKTYWMQNNPTERDSTELTSYFKSPENKRAFALATLDYDSKLESGNPSPQLLWNKPYLNFYGVNYNIKFSSLYYGASGSVVYNEFGEIIGIYSGVRANNTYGNLLDSASFTSLIQRTQVKLAHGILQPYNLIDGSNKELYPKQTNSYRENLRIIYPDGFEDGTHKTALFPEGY